MEKENLEKNIDKESMTAVLLCWNCEESTDPSWRYCCNCGWKLIHENIIKQGNFQTDGCENT